MKRKISLLLCAFIMTLALAGCTGKNDTGITYDKEVLQQYAEVIIGSFAQMDETTFDQFKELSDFELDYNMMQTGLPITGESFIGMIDAWCAAEAECGEYISHGEYEIEEKSGSVVVSTLGQYADRNAAIAISFDESLNMESLDISAKFEVKEILTKAGLNTILGMGTVFTVLIFLAFLIGWIKYIPALLNRDKTSVKAAPEKEMVEETAALTAVSQTVEAEPEDDLELIAVITAAIAAQEGTGPDGFVVRSIRRRALNNWK